MHTSKVSNKRTETMLITYLEVLTEAFTEALTSSDSSQRGNTPQYLKSI